MADPKEDLTLDLPWFRPVYDTVRETPEGMKKYQVCKHCNNMRMEHIGEELKCLFDATTFEILLAPMTTHTV